MRASAPVGFRRMTNFPSACSAVSACAVSPTTPPKITCAPSIARGCAPRKGTTTKSRYAASVASFATIVVVESSVRAMNGTFWK
jgi:hypothetical protein